MAASDHIKCSQKKETGQALLAFGSQPRKEKNKLMMIVRGQSKPA